ncbi:TonB-dependent receptor [soil metagenome]
MKRGTALKISPTIARHLALTTAVLAVSHSAIAFALANAPESAAATTPLLENPAPSVNSGDEIIVTGTRTSGLRVSDSPAPVQVLGNDVLQRVGQSDLIQGLAQNLPSIQAQSFGGNQDAFHLSLKLRGLNPNHTLVLINGKRRHGTANVVVSGGAFGGSAAPDMSFIPITSIDHVEVLQDGAAAQYGTDAIAGVINIIQKKNASGGSLSVTGGHYFDEGGATWSVLGNIGIEPFNGAYLNVSAERKHHGFSFRGDVDPRVINTGVAGNSGATLLTRFPGLVNAPDYPYVNRISGDSAFDLTSVTYNAGYAVTPDTEIYSFGSYGHRNGTANENYRLPNVVVGVAASDIAFPLGFTPQEEAKDTDYSVTGGIKGIFSGTTWDLSSTYGRDINKTYVNNSANASLYAASSSATRNGSTPQDFHTGDFIATQWTNTLDVTHDFDLGSAGSLTAAGGIEYRHETYEIAAGDPTSYYGTGSQAYLGFAPINAGKHSRNNWSEYLDFTFKPLSGLLIDAAVRHEHYSDFGNTTVFKGTGRYDFSPAIAIRGTASTGFRAPTLAEEYYSGIGVGPTLISGNFAPNSPGAAFLGVPGLKAEKSTNFSGGLVLHPISNLTITVDAYTIEIKNRIVQSSVFYGYNSNRNVITSPSIIQALTANGVTIDPAIYTASSGAIGVQTFVNGAKTRTRGLDFVASYASDFGGLGHVDWSLAANYNATKIKELASPPSNVNQNLLILDKAAQSLLINATPKFRATANAYWTLGPIGINLREAFYSPTFYYIQNPVSAAFEKARVGNKFITDVQVDYKVTRSLKLSIGANNLFNIYPDKLPASLRNSYYNISSASYVTQYPRETALNISGGYYYGRATFSF